MAKSRASTARILCLLLPPRLAAQLVAHADITGDDPADVLADAVALHIEAMDETSMARADAELVDEFSAPAGTPRASGIFPWEGP